MDQAAPKTERIHDVYFTTSAKRFYFRNNNHGVELTSSHIKWTMEGTPDDALLSDIVGVHIQTGGNWQDAVSQCQITFADGDRLTATNGNANGVRDDAQTPLYRAFVHDLHQRLAARGDLNIDFTAGYKSGNYQVVLVCAVLLGIIGVVLPVVLFLITSDTKALSLLVGGAFLCWPLAQMVMKNGPRTYDPNHLPEELLN